MMPALFLFAASSGTLLIVGGALDAGNDAVFDALTGAMPVNARDVVIMPAASAVPSTSAEAFARDLARHGVARDRILVAKVAVVDDPATKAIDERGWGRGASDPAEIAKLEHAGAIWFVGGDQARIVATLVRADGRDTPMLAAIRARLAAGAVVGGSSAGAAIMSSPMIAGGDSLGALWRPSARIGEPLAMARGLGFLPWGLVDQHFDTRARLGRLTIALSRLPAADRIGFGIDENTALAVDLAGRRAMAIGAGAVTILDARRARFGSSRGIAAQDILLGLAGGGDRIDLAAGTIFPAHYKRASTIMAGTPILSAAALPSQVTLAPWVGEMISDRPGSVIDRVSTSGRFDIRYRFGKTAATQGWLGRDPAGTERYTLSAVDFSIGPRLAAKRR